jgi:hypothetical protein
MDRITGTFAALAFGIGLSIAAAGGALAQPKDEPCPPASTEGAKLQGSEKQMKAEGAGRDAGTETASAEMKAEGQAVGSVSGKVKRGGCPEIEELMPEEE